ncbi:hypothetical protein ACFPAF_21015 [Hymenobacter endophyticus]|uniref:T9SS type A sorting domain-containing protein n=1 Tax=Hymenobacter endophyticus TaxID=3076335 RepID=A0ABU3TND7_9BACT|nr:hypothetical protein [Hymenobacter endophyticus]MDU0372892.1 hypothetical protein [Hymenobacter endophyticus]
MPNYSALDVATVTPSTVLAKYVNSYTDNPSLPRVSRYIAQEQIGSSLANTAHISFTSRNAEWIFSQMQGTVLPCNAADNECAVTNRITGPNAICPGQQATFGIQNIPPGISVQWSISPAGTVTPLNGTTGSTFTIFAPFSSSGAVIILQAQLSNCSPPITLAVPINNGYVDTQLDLQGAQKVCPYTTAVVRVEGVNVSPPYYWTETRYRNGTPILTGSFTTQIPEYAVSVDEETVEVSVTAASVCTGTNVTASTRTITPYIDPNGGFYCDPTTFRIAPNPADAYVEISTRPTNTPAPTPPAGHANPHAFKAQLHDGNGKVVGTAETQVGLTRLTTATLPAGLYHLVIQRGSKVVRRNIRIQH